MLAGAAFLRALLWPLHAAAVVQISVVRAAVGGLVALTLLWTATNMIVAARSSARPRLPRTLHVMVSEDRGPSAAVTGILVLERSELFGVNILITIYYSERLEAGREDVFERPIGIGRVVNVRQNGLIQVLVLAEVPANADLWQRIRSREAGTLAQLVVKPSIFSDAAGLEVRINE